MSIVAGVDSSTQSCKIVVCDADTGEVLRTGRASHPNGTAVPAGAWLSAYREASADPSLLAEVEAMAVGGQQHGMVALDESGEPVRDALLWNDNRSASDAVDLMIELGGAEAWVEAVGSVPVAAMTVSKIRWLARNEPDNAARTAQVVLPHDWLTWQLGGRSFGPVTDRGDASGTCYFDATTNLYRDDIVELAFGRQLELPRVAEPQELVGETPEGIGLAAGTGDNMAAGLGLGLTHGSAVVSLGTSGTAFAQSARQTRDPSGVVAGFADATGAFLPLVCTLNGARNLAGTAKLLGVDFAEFARLALSAPAGAEGVSFIPYLEGERTPPLPYAKGEMVGLDLDNFTPANIARAAIEGILWSLAYGLRTLAEYAGALDRVILTGGAAQSTAVQQIAPAVLGLPVTVTAVEESVAIGAARQAAWALGGTLPDWPVPQQRELEPTEADVKAAEEIHQRYHGIVTAHYTRI
ncbi:xylulokinase [Microlunatus ginsengisoli]|uniref:Xylulose kinase n=1 Tax=Microlunatus ginsengisoli TaxID=363863 RepID=A0ABP7A5D4_9ACTN